MEGNNNVPDHELSSAEVHSLAYYKEQADKCLLSGNFKEACLHLTTAIKLTPSEYKNLEAIAALFASRSMAYVKLKQLYHANEDAERTIYLRPDWNKGYVCRAECMTEAGFYDRALMAFSIALQIYPMDIDVLKAAKRAAMLSNRDRMMQTRIPWLGAGIGIIIGIIIVLADQIWTQKPSIKSPAVMVLLVIVISAMGFGIAKAWNYFARVQRQKLLEPPLDLVEAKTKAEEAETGAEEQPAVAKARTPRYSKAQARQRLKKGKV